MLLLLLLLERESEPKAAAGEEEKPQQRRFQFRRHASEKNDGSRPAAARPRGTTIHSRRPRGSQGRELASWEEEQQPLSA